MFLSQVSFSVNPCYYCYFSCFFPPFPLNALHFFFIYCYFFLLFLCLPAYCYSASPIPLSSLCLSLHCCTLSVLYHISPEELFFPTILESFALVKGAVLLLEDGKSGSLHQETSRTPTSPVKQTSGAPDMRHTHLRAMIEHLRPEDTVKLVSTRVFTNHISKIRKMSH
uniref:Uncharacterized protein n=1 Tax=Oreochromis niloticus TaxID=8128 RepID=A0A669D5X2_ORENI